MICHCQVVICQNAMTRRSLARMNSFITSLHECWPYLRHPCEYDTMLDRLAVALPTCRTHICFKMSWTAEALSAVAGEAVLTSNSRISDSTSGKMAHVGGAIFRRTVSHQSWLTPCCSCHWEPYKTYQVGSGKIDLHMEIQGIDQLNYHSLSHTPL